MGRPHQAAHSRQTRPLHQPPRRDHKREQQGAAARHAPLPRAAADRQRTLGRTAQRRSRHPVTGNAAARSGNPPGGSGYAADATDHQGNAADAADKSGNCAAAHLRRTGTVVCCRRRGLGASRLRTAIRHTDQTLFDTFNASARIDHDAAARIDDTSARIDRRRAGNHGSDARRHPARDDCACTGTCAAAAKHGSSPAAAKHRSSPADAHDYRCLPGPRRAEDAASFQLRLRRLRKQQGR